MADGRRHPSGFAGGRFTRDYPDQRMKALAARRIPAEAGKPIALPPGMLAAWADGRILDIGSGKVATATIRCSIFWTPRRRVRILTLDF